VHAALVPEHLREGGLRLGGSFLVAALTLGVLAAVVRTSRHDRWAVTAAIAALVTISALYLLSRTSGLPFLIPQAESADPVGVLTTTAELSAALAAAALRSSTRKDQT
jgi:hypothetical protein